MGIFGTDFVTCTFIAVKWVAAVIFVWTIVCILFAQRKQTRFRSPFYTLFMLHLLAEIMNFLAIELILRPMVLQPNRGQPNFYLFLWMTYMLSVVALGHVLLALNRYTVFKYPLRYKKIMGIWGIDYLTFSIIVVKWSAAVMFFWIIASILIVQREQCRFRSSFYVLFTLHLVAELANFFSTELILRPMVLGLTRGPPFFNLIHLITYMPSVVALGHVLLAMNRYTVFKYPIRQKKIWSTRTVVGGWCVAWVLPSVFIISIYYVTGDMFNLKLYVDILTVSIVCVACSYFYGYAIYKADHRKSVDVKLLICATVASLPLLVELIRLSIAYYGLSHRSYMGFLALNAWLYTDAIGFSLQVIVPMTINTDLRHIVFHPFEHKKGTVTVVAVTTLNQRQNGKLVLAAN